MRFKVTFEAREHGALGKFEPRAVIVDAVTRDRAYQLAMDRLHAAGYQTRFSLAAVAIGDAPLATEAS